MRFSFITVALILFTQSACAFPASATPASPEPAAIAMSFPIAQLGASSTKSNTTLPLGGIHMDAAQQTFPATLLLCELENCANCEELSLQVLAENLGTCFGAAFPYISVAISQPSNEGLPFIVGAAVPGCSSFLAIPTVNVCFNINAPTELFEEFILEA
ncbi:hypothetical protein BC628DRAFT_1420933 [Trametes gibbosa]|nr:hypothetical protein BC628DRAFT_1420933 [Trametes gibbosa]